MNKIPLLEKINLKDKLNQINEFWSPKIVGELNDSYVKLAKLKGEFVWHQHEKEDELFFIISGTLLIKFRDREIILNAGEFLIIPKGVEHLPVAENEVHIMLIEPKTTISTGNVDNGFTIHDLDHLCKEIHNTKDAGFGAAP